MPSGTMTASCTVHGHGRCLRLTSPRHPQTKKTPPLYQLLLADSLLLLILPLKTRQLLNQLLMLPFANSLNKVTIDCNS